MRVLKLSRQVNDGLLILVWSRQYSAAGSQKSDDACAEKIMSSDESAKHRAQ